MLWSTVATAFNIALGGMSYFQLLFIATGVSFTFLSFVIIKNRQYKQIIKLSFEELLIFAVLGFLNPFLYYLLLFNAYSMLRAQEALVLNYTWAIMLVILSAPILKQKLKINGVISVIISFIGVLVIATQGDLGSFEFRNPIGVILALLSAVVWAIYWLYSAKLNYDMSFILFMNFLFGFVYILIFQLFFVESPRIVPILYLAGVYVGLFEMGITFLLWLSALKLADRTSFISNLILLTPFCSLILIHFLLGEKINFSTIIGLFFIIFGIIISKIDNLTLKKSY